VRGAAVFWLLAAAMAFLVTAGAFLLLASLATRPAAPAADAGRIPSPQPASRVSGGAFVEVDEGGLGSLEPAPEQRLTVRVRNVGEAALSGVDVDLAVFPAGSPAGGEPRTYREEVGDLPPGQSAEVAFTVDLSPVEASGGVEGEERAYVEVRATTGTEPAADVKTIVLAPAGN